jgi:HSP20 family molecular chaperone IbpA
MPPGMVRHHAPGARFGASIVAQLCLAMTRGMASRAGGYRAGMESSDAATAALFGTPDGEGQRVPVNVYETDNALVVVAPMPGITADDIEVSMQGDLLVLAADVRSDASKRRYLAREWDYGGYYRELTIPEGFGVPITATLGNGQLAVSLTRGGVVGDGPLSVRPT